MMERIVVAIDVGHEMGLPLNGHKRLDVVVNCLKNWIVQKEALYAIIALSKTAELSLDFTSEQDMLFATLESLCAAREPDEPFDFNTLEVPQDATRLVVLFGRSDHVPVGRLEHLNLHLDVVYVHKKAADGGECQAVYTFLTTLNAGVANSYFFETATSLPKLQQHFAMLLAHPRVRDSQDAMLLKLDWKASG